MDTRYDYGGDEFIFVDFDIEMSLEVNFKVLSVCQEIERQRIGGLIEVCPANTSYMVHYDPEKIEPPRLMKMLREIEHKAEHIESLSSRLVDIPVLYDDPWTKECAKRFADRHQDASVSNLEYLMAINGYSSKNEIHRRPFWHAVLGVDDRLRSDQFSFRVGNMLVGNPADAAALEITFAGPLMETTEEGVIAVTGADLGVTLNGTRVPLWVTHRVRPGHQVVCGQVERGVRA